MPPNVGCGPPGCADAVSCCCFLLAFRSTLALSLRVRHILDHQLASVPPIPAVTPQVAGDMQRHPSAVEQRLSQRLCCGAECNRIEPGAVPGFQSAAHMCLADDLGEPHTMRRKGKARLWIALT